jgi:hypothetical protein
LRGVSLVLTTTIGCSLVLTMSHLPRAELAFMHFVNACNEATCIARLVSEGAKDRDLSKRQAMARQAVKAARANVHKLLDACEREAEI